MMSQILMSLMRRRMPLIKLLPKSSQSLSSVYRFFRISKTSILRQASMVSKTSGSSNQLSHPGVEESYS